MQETSYRGRDARRKTRYRGISYRERPDGSRRYSVFYKGRYIAEDAAGNALATESAALERQGELRGAKAKGHEPIVSSKMLFGELAESWLESKARHLRARTISYYRDALDRVLLPRFEHRRVASISADDVAQLIRDLERDGLHAIDSSRPKRGLGHSSISNYLKPLQGVMGLAMRRRLIGTNPFQVLTPDERPKRKEREKPFEWSDENIEALLAASSKLAAKKESRADYSLILRVAATLGLRISECLGLQWGDFDSAAGVLHVRRQYLRTGEYTAPKTEAGVRDIPIPNGPTGLKQALLEHKAASRFKGDSDPIFAARSGRPFSHRNVTRRGFEAARDEAGLPNDLTFHDLRHAAASRLISNGLDPVTVAAVLGHSDPHVTLKVYAHLFNRDQRDDAIRRALEGEAQ